MIRTSSSDSPPQSPSTSSSHMRHEPKQEFIHYFNSKNAKFVAFAIVCGFVLYHSILRLSHGIDSCRWLLSDGNFRDQVWQPYGCMMHHYSQTDSRRCLRYMEYWGGKNYFVFIGDTRTEQLYHAFIRQISSSYQEPQYKDGVPDVQQLLHTLDSQQQGNSASNYAAHVSNGRISHDQLYNDSHLGLRVQYLYHAYPNKQMIQALHKWKNSDDKPSVVVIASGAWPIKANNPFDNSVADDFTASLTHLVVNIDRLAEGTKILWAMQEPVNEEKLSEDWAPLNNNLIDLYNENAKKVLRYSKAEIWSSGRRVAAENILESPDGYHLSKKTLFHDAQILLNMYCNDNMNYNDATCCSSSESVSSLQIVTFAILIISFALATIAFIRRTWWYKFCGVREYGYISLNLKFNGYCSCSSGTKPADGFYNVLIALAKLALIMSYFFLCDRTTMFMKENKYFTQTNFWLPVIYILVLGIFFTEDSMYTKVLHPDQDNETKGWMVLLILVYNMMGASQVVPIFMFVKILYSGFLFLHGWSQFLSYLQRGDYGVVRFLQDLFRLNIMTVLLCFCMNRPYQFYEFIPLISFWTLVIYVGLSIPPRITWSSCEANSLHYLYLVLKIVGIFLFITILYMSEVFFEKVFVTRPWKALFVTTDDEVGGWWTRWKIDRYSESGSLTWTIFYMHAILNMPCGMVLAFGYHLARRYKILEDDNHQNLFSTRISLSVILFSVLGIGGYCTFSLFCRNQLECIEIHSYIGFIPVTSYILLRNVSGMLRTRFSSFFAWFGHFWVELLVARYHIWMGADGHGVLVLVPAYPVGNVLLTAFVFVCTAHEIRRCTDVLQPYCVPDDWRKAIRNFVLFLLVLVPIGIMDGMF